MLQSFLSADSLGGVGAVWRRGRGGLFSVGVAGGCGGFGLCVCFLFSNTQTRRGPETLLPRSSVQRRNFGVAQVSLISQVSC